MHMAPSPRTVSEGKSFDSFADAKCVARWGEGSRENEVTCLNAVFPGDLTSPTSEDSIVAVGRKRGTIDLLSGRSGTLVTTIPSTSGQDKEGRAIRSLSSFWKGDASSLVSGTASGHIRIHSRDAPDSEWTEAASFESKVKGLAGASLFRPTLQLALGGEGTDLAIWDLEARDKAWQAKNAKPNHLGISEKPGITAVTHVPGSQGKKVATGTAQRKLRLYDTGAQKRPVLEVAWGEGRVTCLAPESENAVWAANALGVIQLWDLRTNRMQDVLKGHGGSVRALHRHPSEPYVASVGLDRWLRIHHSKTRALVGKVYLKQQLTAVRFVPGEVVAEEERREAPGKKGKRKQAESEDEEERGSEEEEGGSESDDSGSDDEDESDGSDLDDEGARGPGAGKRKFMKGGAAPKGAQKKFRPGKSSKPAFGKGGKSQQQSGGGRRK